MSVNRLDVSIRLAGLRPRAGNEGTAAPLLHQRRALSEGRGTTGARTAVVTILTGNRMEGRNMIDNDKEDAQHGSRPGEGTDKGTGTGGATAPTTPGKAEGEDDTSPPNEGSPAG
jgi:hypothetical protein